MDFVELRITAGAEVGRLIHISDKPMVFGRTAQADVVITDDRLVSSRHFQILIEEQLACLIDLESTNGTTLNGIRVASAQLSEGDLVVAGSTSFLVKTVPRPLTSSDDQADEQPSSHSFNPFDSYHGPQGKRIPTGTVEAGGVREKRALVDAVKSRCAGDLTRLKGKLADESQVVGIVESLRKLGSVYLIADFSRFDAELPEGLDIDSSSIFDWLPAAAAIKTPLLLELKECDSWEPYIEESWGFDAVVILQSTLAKQDLLNALRELLYRNKSQDHLRQPINGFCWPTCLAPIIERDPEELGSLLMQHVEVAMVETPGDPKSWQIYAADDIVEKFVKLGFKITEEAIQPSAEPAIE